MTARIEARIYKVTAEVTFIVFVMVDEDAEFAISFQRVSTFRDEYCGGGIHEIIGLDENGVRVIDAKVENVIYPEAE